MSIFFAADHTGVSLKMTLLHWAELEDYEVYDLGALKEEVPVDYPDFAASLARRLKEEDAISPEPSIGVLICGSGIGISMAANRFPHIRCAVCRTLEEARLARAHNNANVIAFGARFQSHEEALSCLETFIKTPFEGGRHQNRVAKLEKLC